MVESSSVYSSNKSFTLSDARAIQSPTPTLFCTLADNTWIRFGRYTVRDAVNKTQLLSISEEHNKMADDYARRKEASGQLTMEDRVLKHRFNRAFFYLKSLQLDLSFHVLDKEIKQLTLIEKHYFKGKLISEFEFNFPFCMPNSTNNWQYTYDLPQLTPEQQQEMVDSPYETKSDSFFFVGDQLIVHNKASYDYSA